MHPLRDHATVFKERAGDIEKTASIYEHSESLVMLTFEELDIQIKAKLL
jgi:hypothetical protein